MGEYFRIQEIAVRFPEQHTLDARSGIKLDVVDYAVNCDDVFIRLVVCIPKSNE